MATSRENHRERWNKVLNFEPVDRIPVTEMGYWDETLERWRLEGMPPQLEYRLGRLGYDDDLAQFLGLDFSWHANRVQCNLIDPDPPFEEKIIADAGETLIVTDKHGAVCRQNKNMRSVPQFIKFAVENRVDFLKIKQRYWPDSPVRYPPHWPDYVIKTKNREYPIVAEINGWFGTLRNWIGLENLCYAYFEQAAWIEEMSEFWTDYLISAATRLFDEVDLDLLCIWEDMSYKSGPLISPALFRRFMTPHYRRFTDFAASKGIRSIFVDSDGSNHELIPLLKEGGVNGIFPLEIAADNDIAILRREHPDFVFMGGVDKREIAKGRAAIDAELRKVGKLAEAGGFVPFIDHHVPPDISLADFRYYVSQKRKILSGVSI